MRLNMKKTFSRIGAVLLAALILVTTSVDTFAEDRSYTYNYDFWGDVQYSPDIYTPSKVFTSSELGLEKGLKNPQGLTVSGDLVYLCDTGNNRIIKMKRSSRETIEVLEIIDSFTGNSNGTFSSPTDVAVSEDGNIFVADMGNSRILKLSPDYKYISEFSKPQDSTLDPELVFSPSKIVVDTAERVYCIASGINKGLIKYEADGTFSGFVGATRAIYNFTDYIWKKIASQEQLAKMNSFVPTEYENIYMDHDGFIYACTTSVTSDDLRSGSADAVRRLNLLGTDILVKNGVYYDGEFPVYGDLYMGNGGGYEGPSLFADVTAFENDSYICLDRNRGRLFGYTDQGELIFVCGGNGNMDGYFRKCTSIDHMGYDLLVVDQIDCAITLFSLTDFGEKVFSAMTTFDEGLYEQSENYWKEVMTLNGNYDLAYIGLGRALLRQKEYKEAMEYFKVKYDADNYSKAFKQYRKIWVEENIVKIVIVLLALFLIPGGINKVKKLKHEIATADIFK